MKCEFGSSYFVNTELLLSLVPAARPRRARRQKEKPRAPRPVPKNAWAVFLYGQEAFVV